MMLRILLLALFIPAIAWSQTVSTARLLVRGFTEEHDSLAVVKSNNVFKTLPDTVVSNGERLKIGWLFVLPLDGPQNLYLRKNDKRWLQLFIQPGDSIVVSKENDSTVIEGRGSEWNLLRLKYVKLASSTYLNNNLTKVPFRQLEDFLDSSLSAAREALSQDARGRVIPEVYQRHIEASWYAQWATIRCMHLHNNFFLDPSKMKPVSGEYLGFTAKIPEYLLYPPYVSPFEQFFDLYYRVYLYETMFDLKKQMIDKDVLLQTAKVIPKKHSGIMRDNLMLAFMASIVEDMKDWLEPVIDTVIKDYGKMNGNKELYSTAKYLVKKSKTTGKGK